MATILITLALLAAVALIIRNLVKNRGRCGSCGCGCSGCPSSSAGPRPLSGREEPPV